MLNGIDPIILINFKIKVPDAIANLFSTPQNPNLVGPSIPPVPQKPTMIDLPIVPLYISERLTGVLISSESKGIEIQTDTDTLSNGQEPETNQRGIQSTVRVEMVAKKNSLGLLILSALSDLIFPKVTSKEYSITYLHESVTVFNGLLHSFNISQNSNDDRCTIVLELIKPANGRVKSSAPVVENPKRGEIPPKTGA